MSLSLSLFLSLFLSLELSGPPESGPGHPYSAARREIADDGDVLAVPLDPPIISAPRIEITRQLRFAGRGGEEEKEEEEEMGTRRDHRGTSTCSEDP